MFLTKKQPVQGVAFDIGTASVSAVLFEVREPGAKPDILKTYREYHKTTLGRGERDTHKISLAKVASILKQISADQKNKMPEEYTLGLSSLFYFGKTERIYERFPKSQTITERAIHDYIDQGKQHFLSDAKRDDVAVFETIVMKSELNGYLVSDMAGKNIEELELWVHFAATSAELCQTFTDLVKSFRADAKITFATFPISTWKVMREVIFPEHAVLLVDVGGDLTEVTMLSEGIIKQVLSLPFGVTNILMRLAETEHTEIENAANLLKAYTAGDISQETAARIRDIIKREMKNWEIAFERVWQEANRELMVNIKMFFFGGGALIEEMKAVIVPPLLHPDLAKGLNVSIIAPNAFRDKFGTFVNFDGPADFGLLSLVLHN